MATLCPGCKLNVDPIRVFERSTKTKKAYIIVRCPRWRCNFNIDIEDYEPKLKSRTSTDDDNRHFWKDYLGG